MVPRKESLQSCMFSFSSFKKEYNRCVQGKKKVCVLIPWQKNAEYVGWFKISFYFEILILRSPPLAVLSFEKFC